MQSLFSIFTLSVFFITGPYGVHGEMDTIHVNAKVICRLPERMNDFCFEVDYGEEDILYDDYFNGYVPITCGGKTTSEYTGKYEIGDGLFDGYYEFFGVVRHTCTDDGRIRMYKFYFEPVSVEARNITLNFTTVATNLGVSNDRRSWRKFAFQDDEEDIEQAFLSSQ